MKLNQSRLAKALLKKLSAEGISFRAAAKSSDISAATLNRLANRQFLPDVNTYAKCCRWLEEDMIYFFDKR